jgi:hypothetical protein
MIQREDFGTGPLPDLPKKRRREPDLVRAA